MIRQKTDIVRRFCITKRFEACACWEKIETPRSSKLYSVFHPSPLCVVSIGLLIVRRWQILCHRNVVLYNCAISWPMVRLHEVMIDNNAVLENKHKSFTAECSVHCISFYIIGTFWSNFILLQTFRNKSKDFGLMSYSLNVQFTKLSLLSSFLCRILYSKHTNM